MIDTVSMVMKLLENGQLYLEFHSVEFFKIFETLVKSKKVNALFIVEVHLAIKLVYRYSTVKKVKVTIQT